MSLSVSASEPAVGRPRALPSIEVAPVLVGLLTICALILRLTQMRQSLYGDEIWTYQDITGRSLGSVINHVHAGAENSPPLFFVLAWAAAKLGNPTVWIRAPSLILGVATVPLTYMLGRETAGRAAGLIGAAVLTCGPFSAYYGIEARPYATMAFFVSLSTLALIRAVRSGSRWAWALYVVAAAAGAYSHYTAVFVLCVQGVWALWTCWRRRRIVEPLVASAVAILLYLPWIPHLRGKSLPVIGALEPLTLHNVLIDLPRPLFGYPYASLRAIPTRLGLVAIGMCVIAGAAFLAVRLRRGIAETAARVGHRRLPGEGLRLIGAVAAATPVALLVYSILGDDLWTARGLYASVPAGAVTLGALLAAPPRRVRASVVAVVLVLLVAGTIRAISPSYARPPFRRLAEYIDRVARPPDPVIVYPSLLHLEEAVPAQLRKPHRLLVNQIPRRWPATPVGERVYVLIDDATARYLRLSTPNPVGFTLSGTRHYSGLVSFTLLMYRALPGAKG